MKQPIILLLLLLLFTACSEPKINPDLLGAWTSTHMDQDFTFYKDSLIYRFAQPIKFSWSSDDSKIYIEQLTHVNPKLPTRFVEEYKFSQNKDTLFLNHVNDTMVNQLVRK